MALSGSLVGSFVLKLTSKSSDDTKISTMNYQKGLSEVSSCLNVDIRIVCELRLDLCC